MSVVAAGMLRAVSVAGAAGLGPAAAQHGHAAQLAHARAAEEALLVGQHRVRELVPRRAAAANTLLYSPRSQPRLQYYLPPKVLLFRYSFTGQQHSGDPDI